ncbi:SemiSWEET family sugar transporter [Zobellia galactanivorans]|uniref:SemiSWEET family sugar transporter n=1 Tax=Zobellia galactanivorans (strain DSM 12802 / CCUG 47099 / CIP 106680 / NCIMB 13871 / Dsij) TaxID=63186 RepID=UPI0020911696|nr:SemiSWEET family transporter [Zobellia galactanivorans]
MDTLAEEIIGLIAASFTTISFIPQVFRTWKTKSANSLSWFMLGISITAAILWVSYGVYLQNTIIILSNSIMGILQLCLICFKFLFKSFSHS